MKGIRQPALNPLRAVKKDYVFPKEQWSFPNFGESLHKDTMKTWRMNEEYLIPYTRNDNICIMYHRGTVDGGSNPTELWFYNENGTFLKYINPTDSYQFTGYVDEETGEQLTSEYFQFTFGQYSELNNAKEIRMLLRVYYSDSTVDDYVYEPILLATEHRNTSLMQWTNLTNKNTDVPFEQWRLFFTCRFPSFGMEYESGGEYLSFKNQKGETQKISGKSTNMSRLNVGGAYGVPDYVIDAIDSALDCDKIRVNGKMVVRDSKELNRIGGANKSLGCYECMLQDINGNISFDMLNKTVELYTAPTPPYAVADLMLTDDIQYLFLTNSNGHFLRVIDDSSAETSYISALNANLSANGFSGVVSKSGDKIILTNAEGERLKLFKQVEVFDKVLTVNFNVGTAGSTLQYNLTYSTSGAYRHVVSWGSTSGDDDLKAITTGTVITVTKNYASTGLGVFRIFHRDLETGMSSYNSSTQPKFTALSGSISNKLSSFALRKHNLGSHSLAYLARAKDSLTYLMLDECSVSSIQDGWAQNLVSGSYRPFSKLYVIDLVNNAMNTTRVDAFFNEAYNYMHYWGGVRYMYTNGGTSGASSGASSTARTSMTNVNITTN